SHRVGQRPQPLHAQPQRNGGARGPRSRGRSPCGVRAPARAGDGLRSEIGGQKTEPRQTARGPELVRSSTRTYGSFIPKSPGNCDTKLLLNENVYPVPPHPLAIAPTGLVSV